jgi:spoIIIJ-associated protein
MIKEENLKLIKDTVNELLEKLLISSEIVVVEDDNAVKVTIETAEPGMLIGRHGCNLEAIQILVGQMIFKKTGEWHRIIISVGDYRDRRAKQLQELALNLAEKVVATKEPAILRDLTPAERRVVHLTLGNHEQVVSESEGEGRDRHLVIKLKV